MKNISKLIVVINWGLLVATAISFLILILGWFSLQCPCCCICRIDCEYTLKVSGALLTLWIASYQLAKYIDVETINSLAQLREMLNSEEKKKIHTALFDPEDKEPILPELQSKNPDRTMDFSNAEFFDYIGTIELGAIMVRRGVISVDEFYNQFGYRVENIWANESVKKHISNNKSYYKDLNFIIRRLVNKGYLSS